jgi:fatty acid desaturase
VGTYLFINSFRIKTEQQTSADRKPYIIQDGILVMNTNNTTQHAKQFMDKSDLYGALSIARNWLAIAAAIGFSLWADNLFAYIAAAWVIGAFQFALGEQLVHEASHYKLFRTKKLNDGLELLYGLPLFCTLKEYRVEHQAHHSHLGDANKDHAVYDYQFLGLNQRPRNPLWTWLGRPLSGYVGFLLLKLYYFDDNEADTDEQHASDSWKLLVFWLPVVAVFVYFDAFDLLFWYWLLPFVWCYYSFVYWEEMIAHFATTSGTRTVSGFWYNLLLHNQGYHALHHRYPSMPWYRMKAAYQALHRDDPRVVGDLALSLWDAYRQVRVHWV